MATGDFNSVTSQDEKIGGSSMTIQETCEFNDMFFQIGLIDTGFFGNRFTWTNNRIGKNRILERLDRALINND